ncbi:MAG: hypothetical protein JNK87_15645 [Bryobacterales bacterium]|nr:hypothetical protein [Bryobacterales bacterium]
MPLILVAIDGTGPDPGEKTTDGKEKYDEAFCLSFVKTVHDRAPTIYKKYLRGPTELGLETGPLAAQAAKLVRKYVFDYRAAIQAKNAAATLAYWAAAPKQQTVTMPGDRGTMAMAGSGQPLDAPPKQETPEPVKICLVGYSRGAAALICTAGLLSTKMFVDRATGLSRSIYGVTTEEGPLDVDYLVMFDPVDRSFVDAGTVPSNVKQVFSVLRDPVTKSREFMGNCGSNWDSGTTKRPPFPKFTTTHGGMGGTPWCTDPDWQAKFKDKKDGSGKTAASEWWGKKVEEVADGSRDERTFYAWGSVKNLYKPLAGRHVSGLQEVAEAKHTDITHQQDLDGSKAVWDAIAPKLLAAGIITNAEWPGKNIKYNLAHGLPLTTPR